MVVVVWSCVCMCSALISLLSHAPLFISIYMRAAVGGFKGQWYRRRRRGVSRDSGTDGGEGEVSRDTGTDGGEGEVSRDSGTEGGEGGV